MCELVTSGSFHQGQESDCPDKRSRFLIIPHWSLTFFSNLILYLFWCSDTQKPSTLGMKSRASVTVMVTWVCVKESSNIQSGWREGKVNLRETENTQSCNICNTHRHTADSSCPAFKGPDKMPAHYRNRWNMVERSSSLWMAMPM